MKKSVISKIIILIVTFSLVAYAFTTVFAIDDIPSLDGEFNFTDTSTDGNSTGNSIENSVENNTGNSIGNSIENNNSSSYQQSDIPYAGPETSILTIVAFVICGIIGIYTFMKLSNYSNI